MPSCSSQYSSNFPCFFTLGMSVFLIKCWSDRHCSLISYLWVHQDYLSADIESHEQLTTHTLPLNLWCKYFGISSILSVTIYHPIQITHSVMDQQINLLVCKCWFNECALNIIAFENHHHLNTRSTFLAQSIDRKFAKFGYPLAQLSIHAISIPFISPPNHKIA